MTEIANSATPGVTGGMLRRQCTAEYKIEVCERIIRRRIVGLQPRQRMPKGVKVVQDFGLSYDEPRRVSKVRNRFVGHPWAEARFRPRQESVGDTSPFPSGAAVEGRSARRT